MWMWMCMCKFKLKDSMGYYDEDLPIDIMIIIFRALNSNLHIYTTVFELSFPSHLSGGFVFVSSLYREWTCYIAFHWSAIIAVDFHSTQTLVFSSRSIEMTLNRLARVHDNLTIFDIFKRAVYNALSSNETKRIVSHLFLFSLSQLVFFFTV